MTFHKYTYVHAVTTTNPQITLKLQGLHLLENIETLERVLLSFM